MTAHGLNYRARIVLEEMLLREMTGAEIVDLVGTNRTIDALLRRRLIDSRRRRNRKWILFLTKSGREAALHVTMLRKKSEAIN